LIGSFRKGVVMASIGPECSFLIPVNRDAEISDGVCHSVFAWDWLDKVLLQNGFNRTISPGNYQGMWTNPKTGKPISDLCRRYITAVAPNRVDELRNILKEACQQFAQQCIYLSVAGQAELIEPDHEPTT
jgi:hypothetical protein